MNCLPSNRTLWRLELAGNNVPSDVLRAVGKGTQLQAGRRADFLWPRPRLWARGLEGLSQWQPRLDTESKSCSWNPLIRFLDPPRVLPSFTDEDAEARGSGPRPDGCAVSSGGMCPPHTSGFRAVHRSLVGAGPPGPRQDPLPSGMLASLPQAQQSPLSLPVAPLSWQPPRGPSLGWNPAKLATSCWVCLTPVTSASLSPACP